MLNSNFRTKLNVANNFISSTICISYNKEIQFENVERLSCDINMDSSFKAFSQK